MLHRRHTPDGGGTSPSETDIKNRSDILNNGTEINDAKDGSDVQDLKEDISDSDEDSIAAASDSTEEMIRGQSQDNRSLDSKDAKLSREYREKRKKARLIKALLNKDDVEKLRFAAASKWGLVTDNLRRKVWPKLVNVGVYETNPRPEQKEIEAHPYYNQVILDVNRSLKRFPPSIEEKRRLAMQDQLVLLIMRVLLKHPELHYYQGYHDICVTFLLILGEEVAFNVVDSLSTSHLRVFMDETMERTTEVLSYLYPLVEKKNPELHDFLVKSEVGIVFCLSWLITWFGHVLNECSDVMRLFDLFTVTHPWMPVYLSVAILLYRQKEILELQCEMAIVHCYLSHIPDEDLPFEKLISDAQELFEKYPPKVLEAECEYVKNNVWRNPKERKKHILRWPFALLDPWYGRVRGAVANNWRPLSLTMAAFVAFYAVMHQMYGLEPTKMLPFHSL